MPHMHNPQHSTKAMASGRVLLLSLLLALALAGFSAVVEGFGLPRGSRWLQRLPGGQTSRRSILAFAGGADGQQPYKPKVYAYHRSRSKIIEWYCQELGISYETVPVAMDKMEHKDPAFIQSVNPFGKLPVITMADGKPLIESGAQLMYLFDVFDPHAKTAEDRAIAAQWCMFANASLGPAIFVKEQREGGQMGKTFEVLDQILKKSPYLEGDRFGVSDVAVGSYLAYIPRFFPDVSLDAYSNLKAYVERVTARPAFKSTVGAPPPAEA